jgi:hypothetical protein
VIAPENRQATGARFDEPPGVFDNGDKTDETEQSTETRRGIPLPTISESEADASANTLALLAVVGPIGTGVAATLAAAVAVRRKRRLDQRPIGKALPPLPPKLARLEQALDMRGAIRPDLVPSPDAGDAGDAGDANAVFVTLGTDSDNQTIEFDLGGAGLVEIIGNPTFSVGMLTALAAQFIGGTAPNADVTYVGTQANWLRDLDDSRLTVMSDSAQAMRNLHALLRARIDSVTDTAQVPVVFLFESAPPTQIPRGFEAANVSIIVIREQGVPVADHVICVASESSATLMTDGLVVSFAPGLATSSVRDQLQTLTARLADTAYVPAHWWSVADAPVDGESSPTNTTVIDGTMVEVPAVAVVPPSDVDGTTFRGEAMFGDRPYLQLLGPVILAGARGEVPARAAKQCAEYCAWIMLHPGATSLDMSRDLLVAEGTRRSNMSRLRAWLGTTADGEQYLPDAYSGRIELHSHISSDWEHFRLLTAGGINRTADDALRAALSLVRGAPFSDAVPGSWRWVEPWRVEMVSQIRDAAAELAGRALEHHDATLARWAVERGTAAVGLDDEVLLTLKVRIEQACDNRHELSRLVLQITRRSRQLGEDLSDAMVDLLREVVETGVRA